MIIGIDGNEANEKMRVGVHQYAFSLLKNLAQLRHEWEEKHQFIIFLKNPPQQDFPKEFPGWKYTVLPGGGMWILKKLTPYLLKNSTLDIFFAPNHYLPPISRVPMVCAIMDLGYLNNAEQFTKRDFWQLKYWSAISMRVAKMIITISQNAKEDIAHNYKFAGQKTVVTPLGYDKDTFTPEISQESVKRVLEKYKIDNDYILFLSTLKPSKNIARLLDAYKILFDKNQKVPMLVIAGKKGWMYDPIFLQVKHLGLTQKVRFTDFIPEEDKPSLMKGARVFVSPSLWEGFGIHVLEAMGSGTPVVVSNIASLPEVGGNAAVYVDPSNALSIAKGIQKVLSLGEIEYNKLKEECLAQASTFSWEKTARETLDILVRAASK